MELQDLMQFERWIEATMMGVLAAACENIYSSRLTSINATPRIGCKAIAGPRQNEQKLQILAAPGWIYSSYSGRIETTVTTNRTDDTPDNNHDALVGLARLRCNQFYIAEWQTSQTPPLPILVIDIRPVESDDTEGGDDNTDLTKLTHEIVFSINKDALPTTT